MAVKGMILSQLSETIVLTWHRNCWAFTHAVTLACIIPIAHLSSIGVNFGIANKHSVILNSKVLNLLKAWDVQLEISAFCTNISAWNECAREKREN